jgi:hypothetical protein
MTQHDDQDQQTVYIPQPGSPEYARVLDQLGIVCIAQDIPPHVDIPEHLWTG